MGKAYESYWDNMFNFKDRTSRSGYWYAVLMTLIIYISYTFIFLVFAFLLEDCGYSYEFDDLLSFFGLIFIISTILNIIPSISIVVRRLHDINESGGLYFLMFIPYIGSIIILVFMCLNSVNENNKYGKQV